MKVFASLCLFLLWAVPLAAQQVPVLTELEQVQEKLWFLQRDISSLQEAFDADQAQLDQLASEIRQVEERFEQRLTEFAAANTDQAQLMAQVEATVNDLGEALTTLTAEVQAQNTSLLDQAQQIAAFEAALASLQSEIAAGSMVAGEDLTELRTEVAAVRGHLGENRTRLSALEQDLASQFKKLTYYGAGAVLGLVILLAICVAVMKSREAPI